MQTDSPVDFLLSNRIHSLKYVRSTTLGSKYIGIRNVTLWQQLNSFRLSYLTEVIFLKYEKSTTPACKDIEIRKL